MSASATARLTCLVEFLLRKKRPASKQRCASCALVALVVEASGGSGVRKILAFGTEVRRTTVRSGQGGRAWASLPSLPLN